MLKGEGSVFLQSKNLNIFLNGFNFDFLFEFKFGFLDEPNKADYNPSTF